MIHCTMCGTAIVCPECHAVPSSPPQRHARSCPAYGNYQPPYEECNCGYEMADPSSPAPPPWEPIRTLSDPDREVLDVDAGRAIVFPAVSRVDATRDARVIESKLDVGNPLDAPAGASAMTLNETAQVIARLRLQDALKAFDEWCWRVSGGPSGTVYPIYSHSQELLDLIASARVVAQEPPQ